VVGGSLQTCDVLVIRIAFHRRDLRAHRASHGRRHGPAASGNRRAVYDVEGRFSLNLFVKHDDGAVASESTVGRFSFDAGKYCEWVIYTIRKDLDKPGVTNEAPPVTDHCTPVASKGGHFDFSPPGEGVAVSHGAEGFTATISGEFVDHWTKIQ
jgi:hypothetical protein